MSEAIPAVELRIADNAHEASAGLLLLTSVLERLRTVVSNGLGLENVATGLGRLNESLTNAVPEDSINRLERMAAAMERLNNAGGISMDVGNVDVSGVEAIENAANSQTADAVREVTAAMNAATSVAHDEADAVNVLNTAINEANRSHVQIEDTANNASAAMTNVADAMRRAAAASHEIGEGVGHVGREARTAARHTNGLLRSFARIAKYRAMRWVLKQITEGFKEGVENVREYSKAISGHFAVAMDTADNTLLKMKNSIGAAVAPLIEMLIPVLQTVVSWVINVVNAINQLLALLNGQSSWTKAVDASAASLKDVKKNASGAGKEMKNLLADFDELNIIQSQGGGGGGGSGLVDGTAYKKMFIEVQNFEERIQRVAKFIRDHMDAIKDAAITAGIAIAAWNFSSAFGGILKTLTGLVATGATIAVVFELSAIMMDQYLNTGEDGWLIANALTAAVGGTIAAKIAKKVGLGAAAKYVLPVTLFVSALADIITNVGRTDVAALDEKSVKATILDAAKVGTAVGISIYEIGQGAVTAGESVGFGAAAALVTFGAVIGLKAIANAVTSDEFNDVEYLKETATSSVTMGLGTGLALATAGYKIPTIITGGASAALLTFGVMASVEAVLKAKERGYDIETLKSLAKASLGIGAGAGLAAMFAGAKAGIAAIIGGGAALLTVGVIVGVVALLKAKKDDGVKWGDISLTEEQIQTYVSTKMFNVDVNAAVSVITDRVEGINVNKAKLRTTITKAIGTLKVIKLGVAKSSDYASLKDDVTTIVDEVAGYVKEAKDLGKLTLQFTPSLVGGTEKDAAEWFGKYTTGWDKVNEWVSNQGKLIGAQLVENEAGEIIAKEPEVLAALMQQMTDVTNAISGAKISANAFSNMRFALGDLTQASFEDVMDAFIKYKEELRTAYEDLIREQVDTQAQLVAALFEIDPDSQEYKDALAKLEYMQEHMLESVDEAVDKAAGPGYKTIIDQYLKAQFDRVNTNGFKVPVNIQSAINEALLGGLGMEGALQNVVSKMTGISVKALAALGNSNWWSMVSDDLREQVVNVYRAAFGDDYVDELKRSGIDFDPTKPITEAFDATQQINWTPYGQYITEQYSKTAEFKAEVESLGDIQVTAQKPDLSAIDSTVDTTAGKISRLIELYYSIPFMSRNTAPAMNVHGGPWNAWNKIKYASGGFPETGQMFIAREAGPEMVGTINGKTAVANNDQIVNGVASGVAAGQAEQNALLRQQNEYLRALLNKENTVHVEPSSAWGKFNRRSEAMYARNVGN